MKTPSVENCPICLPLSSPSPPPFRSLFLLRVPQWILAVQHKKSQFTSISSNSVHGLILLDLKFLQTQLTPKQTGMADIIYFRHVCFSPQTIFYWFDYVLMFWKSLFIQRQAIRLGLRLNFFKQFCLFVISISIKIINGQMLIQKSHWKCQTFATKDHFSWLCARPAPLDWVKHVFVLTFKPGHKRAVISCHLCSNAINLCCNECTHCSSWRISDEIAFFALTLHYNVHMLIEYPIHSTLMMYDVWCVCVCVCCVCVC